MKAKVNVRKDCMTTSYWESMNDDHPVIDYKDVWFVEIQFWKTANWGPLKSRPNAKKNHTGSTKVELRDSAWFGDRESAETAACDAAMKLEAMGAEVELVFDHGPFFEDRTFGGRPKNPVIILEAVPHFLRAKIFQEVRLADYLL